MTLSVLHIIPAIDPQYGGPSLVIGPLCSALNRIPGVRSEIATTTLAFQENSNRDVNIGDEITVHRFPSTHSHGMKKSIGLSSWVRDHASDYDLIYIHTLWSFISTFAGRSARRAGIPYIIRPAGMLSPYSWEHKWLKKIIYWWLWDSKLVGHAAGLHATSTGEAAELRGLKLPTPINMLPLGIDPQAWSTAKDSGVLRRLCGPQAENLPIVLFLSRLHPKKGVVDILLPAFASLKRPAFLAIAGGIDDSIPEYRSEIESTITRLGLTQRVALIGHAYPADRWNLFDGADLFVLPSHQENFGLVVSEAMSRGCPVVISDRVQSSDHVLAAGAGMVVPLEIGAFATAMSELLEDDTTRATMRHNGPPYVRSELSWDAIAEKIVEMYRTCLK